MSDHPTGVNDIQRTQAAPEEALASVLPPDVIDRIPPEIRVQVNAAFIGMRPPTNPVANKITSEHITTVLSNVERDSERGFKLECRQQWFRAYVILLAAVFIAILVYTLQEKPQILIPIATGILGFLGGFGVGKKTS